MNKRKPKGFYMFWVFALFILIGIANVIWRYVKLSGETLYTIGYVEKRRSTLKAGIQVDYHFYYNGNKYSTYGFLVKGTDPKEGDRYFVEFSKKNPRASEIDFKNPVPVHITRAPSSGWKQIPIQPARNAGK